MKEVVESKGLWAVGKAILRKILDSRIFSFFVPEHLQAAWEECVWEGEARR